MSVDLEKKKKKKKRKKKKKKKGKKKMIRFNAEIKRILSGSALRLSERIGS